MKMVATNQKQKSNNNLIQYIWNKRMLYLFIMPAFFAVLIFNYIPFWGIILAFEDFNPLKGVWGSEFLGFKHFETIFSSAAIFKALRNTLSISMLGFIFGFPAPIILAILINEVQFNRFKKIVQTISYLPHFVSWVVVAGLMYEVLAINGTVNLMLNAIGIEKINFFSEPRLFWSLSVGISIWKEIGWSAILYLAAIAGIDQSLYEAAVVDGANRFKRIIHITIPGIMPIVSLLLILTAGSILNGAGLSPGFDGVYNLSNPILNDYSEILDLYIYNKGIMESQYSYAAAAGLLFAVVNMSMVLIANKIADKTSDYAMF